jgi:hypothetical protein
VDALDVEVVKKAVRVSLELLTRLSIYGVQVQEDDNKPLGLHTIIWSDKFPPGDLVIDHIEDASGIISRKFHREPAQRLSSGLKQAYSWESYFDR